MRCTERLNSEDLLILMRTCGGEGPLCLDHVFKKLFQLNKPIIAEKNVSVNLAYELYFSYAFILTPCKEKNASHKKNTPKRSVRLSEIR